MLIVMKAIVIDVKRKKQQGVKYEESNNNRCKKKRKKKNQKTNITDIFYKTDTCSTNFIKKNIQIYQIHLQNQN